MATYHKVLSLALSAASANKIALSQTPLASGVLTLNGAAVVSGVAILDAQRQVLFTFASSEVGRTFVITGTNGSGITQSETVAGAGATAVTVNYYKTVTSITIDAASAGAITVGTNGVAASLPWFTDRFAAAANITAAVVTSGTINYSVQVSYDDIGPAYDTVATPPTWFAPPNTSNLTAQTSAKADIINMPVTMVRLLQNSFSTGGTLVLTLNQQMGFIG